MRSRLVHYEKFGCRPSPGLPPVPLTVFRAYASGC
jgi:hypothetical protein